MKIAIQGAGIAGPALAYWLDRHGHEPVLIEKSPQFRTGGYMIDFWGLGYTIAERMGILPQVLERGYKVQEIRLVNQRGGKAGSFSADVFNRMTDGRFISLPRGDLAEAIYDAIRNRVDTIFGDSIAQIEEHSSGVHVTLEDGSDPRIRFGHRRGRPAFPNSRNRVRPRTAIRAATRLSGRRV